MHRCIDWSYLADCVTITLITVFTSWQFFLLISFAGFVSGLDRQPSSDNSSCSGGFAVSSAANGSSVWNAAQTAGSLLLHLFLTQGKSATDSYWILHGSYGQGMWGKFRENQSTRVQKLTKMQKKVWTVLRRLHTTVQNFFLLALLADYLYLHLTFCVRSFKCHWKMAFETSHTKC